MVYPIAATAALLLALQSPQTPSPENQDDPDSACRAEAQTQSPQVQLPRAQVIEGMRKSMGAKLAAAEFYLSKHRPAWTNREAGLADRITSKYVRSVKILPPDGRLEITFGCESHTQIAGKRISWRPYLKNRAVHFDCIVEDRVPFQVPNCKPGW